MGKAETCLQLKGGEEALFEENFGTVSVKEVFVKSGLESVEKSHQSQQS
jgi:hypothetical protein